LPLVPLPADLRPMRPDDAAAVHETATAAFADLARRQGQPPPPADPGVGQVRIRHLQRTDPGGAWVAERGGELVGAALALVREGVWGLSLLVVRPQDQSGGVGRALLAAALAHGRDARGGIILASSDPRALRAYARAGFAMHPAVEATGRPGPGAAPPSVREGGPADLPLTEAVDRAVRGAAHGDDLMAMLATGNRLLVVPDRGYAVLREGEVRLLAARDAQAARDLLRAALARFGPEAEAKVDWITSDQGWAVDVVLDAGLSLRPDGAVFVRGEVGPFSPYLPSGAYL
jgi:GNAT superfamily N-acetyltransferase